MSDLRPSNLKAEFMITYRCQLACSACTRASFFKEPIVPDMTLDDANRFFDEAEALNWNPRIVIIGGEPTLHPQFEEFCLLAQRRSKTYAQVFSNGYGDGVRKKLLHVERSHSTSICRDGFKPDGSVSPQSIRPEWDIHTFVSPEDAGVEPRGICFMHASQICGISIDSQGYAPCAPGGAIAALVAPTGRTKVLADLFDQEKVTAMTEALCRHCGNEYDGRIRYLVPFDHHLARFQSYAKALPTDEYGAPVSPTWQAAFKGRR